MKISTVVEGVGTDTNEESAAELALKDVAAKIAAWTKANPGEHLIGEASIDTDHDWNVPQVIAKARVRVGVRA